MRCVSAIVAAIALTGPAAAQFKGYFDVSKLEIKELAEPAWARRVEDERLLYLCSDENICPTPTGINIKGVIRAEKLEDALASGEFKPETLLAQGKENAARTGSQFMEAKAISFGGTGGVHMEASANKIFFITKFIGKGNQMLDIKVTSPDLALARKLSDQAATALVGQVFN